MNKAENYAENKFDKSYTERRVSSRNCSQGKIIQIMQMCIVHLKHPYDVLRLIIILCVFIVFVQKTLLSYENLNKNEKKTSFLLPVTKHVR